jgi:hypothetical protein
MTDNNHGRHKKILDWSDERAIGNPVMVTLAQGFAFADNNRDDAARHVRGFDTVKEAMHEVRAAAPCTCNRCTGPADAA